MIVKIVAHLGYERVSFSSWRLLSSMGGMIGMEGIPLGCILSPKVGYNLSVWNSEGEGRRDDGGKGDNDDDDGDGDGIDRKAVSIFSCIHTY